MRRLGNVKCSEGISIYSEWDFRESFAYFRVVERICDVKDGITVVEWCKELQILPRYYLQPINYANWAIFYNDGGNERVRNETKNSYAIHFYAAMSRIFQRTDVNLKKESKVPYVSIAKKNCPKVFEASFRFY